MSGSKGITAAALVLADGTVFEGEAIGAEPTDGIATGEVVFTVLSGYQEVITDPSYAGQIITFTYPHIGNYGVAEADNESARPFCKGVIVRELARRRSNWRADGDLDSMLAAAGVPGIAGVDTRRLTRHIRDAGAMPAAFGTASESDLTAAAAVAVGTDDTDLAALVTCAEPYNIASTRAAGKPWRLVAIDSDDILALGPDGVFLSNGPGDPSAVTYAPEIIRGLLDQVPVFGICLGHQLLAETIGGETFKLPFGHHGGNHPVRRLSTGTVEITSQNHNYCVAEGSLSTADVSHINLNDQTVEGLEMRDVPAFSVQYHPEAGPGPHDSRYLFDQFDELIASCSKGGR